MLAALHTAAFDKQLFRLDKGSSNNNNMDLKVHTDCGLVFEAAPNGAINLPASRSSVSNVMDDAWHYVRVTRVGNAITLHIDGADVEERSGLTGSRWSSSLWQAPSHSVVFASTHLLRSGPPVSLLGVGKVG